MKSRLVDTVIELLKNRRYGYTYREIEEETGVPAAWTRKLQLGYIREPSCPRVETLYEHLKGQKLDL